MKNKNVGNPVSQTQQHQTPGAKLKAQLAEFFVSVVGLVTTGAWFVVIWLVAAGLGFLMDWSEVHFVWMPKWMFGVGHVVEGGLFLMDCVGLVWSVFKHMKGQFTKH